MDRRLFQSWLSAENPKWKEIVDEMERTSTQPRTNPDGDVGESLPSICIVFTRNSSRLLLNTWVFLTRISLSPLVHLVWCKTAKIKLYVSQCHQVFEYIHLFRYISTSLKSYFLGSLFHNIPRIDRRFLSNT